MHCCVTKRVIGLCSFSKLANFINNHRNMCIIFIHNGSKDPESDYRLVVATNRDEVFHRPAQTLAPWPEDPSVIGGKDLEAGGTWLAFSALRKKMAVLLNLPSSNTNLNAKSRGELVSSFVKSDTPAEGYAAETIKSKSTEYNSFTLVTIHLGLNPSVQTYNNVSNASITWEEPFLGFSNSLPETPLKKVLSGKEKFMNICREYNKISEKDQLLEKLVELLKDRESHFPDPVLLEARKGMDESYMKALSSVFVYMPQGYGTRTHTIVLLTKTGHMDVIELTMDTRTSSSDWIRTEMQFDL